MDERLTHIDLFSGIGGFSLAAGWAGFETIAFCENEPYCQEVLKARFGGHVTDSDGERTGEQGEDVHGGGESQTIRGVGLRDVPDTENRIPIVPDIRNFDGTKFRGATLLTGGFPCQPFSVAGKRGGKEDDRYLWPEMLRVIKEAQPTWIVAENVTGIVHMALGQVLSDLEGCGYDFPRDVEGYIIVPVIPASAVNAPHRRDRVWIIACATEPRERGGERVVCQEERRQGGSLFQRIDESDKDATHSINREHGAGGGSPGETDSLPGINRAALCTGGISGTGGDAWDSERTGQQSGILGQGEVQSRGTDSWTIPWLEVATRFCRVDDGLPAWVHRHRVKRLKALGNAIVPQVAYEILKGIAEIENSMGIKKERKKT